MSVEITVEGKVYRVGRLNPRKQFHVARRLGPVLLALGKSATVAQETIGMGDDDGDLRKVANAFSPIMDVLSKMSDEDVDYVLTACLSVCELRQGETYARVQHPNGELMFDDMTMPTMMRLAVQVIQENMGNFFATPAAG